MDPTCGLTDKIRDLVWDLIWKHILYLVHYHRNIEQLDGRLDDLNRERSALQHRIDEATNNGKQIEENVLHWLGEVDKISEQVQQLHRESEAKLECGITSCPNPWLRCKLSKRAETIAQVAVEIAIRNFDRVGYDDPLPLLPELTNNEGNEGIDSRFPIVYQIIEELGEPGVNMIGLCGLGGVGKTTIAKEVAKNQKIFEKVIMANVSQELNIEKIQSQIAEKLSMQLTGNDLGVRAFHLCKRLKQEKNMLLILDDLWEELDLGKIGIPLVSVENYSKKNEAHHEDAFPILESLELKNLEALDNLCEGPNAIVFCQLHTLKMENLPALTGDFSIKDRATKNASNKFFKSLFNKVLLPKLEILELSNLNSLIPLIWDGQLLHNSFNNLKTLKVEGCGFVKLVPLHVLKSLNNLEELDVEDCDMLEIVFDFEDLNDYYKEMDSSLVVVPLKKLQLRNLPKLKNVWSNNWQENVSFPSLRSINVYDCESLTSIFPASIAKGMLCDLEKLKIYNCGVDVIVAKDQVSESVVVTFGFPRLTSLVLHDLPNLRNFYPQKHTLEWPHLNQLSIQCCDKLEIFEKEVSGSSEIYEEENMLHSKYPLLPHDKVIDSLEMLAWQGKEVEKIGSGQFLMYHFPKLKRLHLSLEEEPSFPFWGRSPNSRELKLSGDFEKALGGDNVAALTAHFPQLTLENISIMGSLSPSLVSSPNLTHLNVQWCKGTTLMTSSIARSLVHLTHLSISHCLEMKEIITKQEGEDDEDKEIFLKKMKLLELDNLPRLKRFCGYNYTFKFLLLHQLIIIACPKFKIFSHGLIETPSLKSVQLRKDWENHQEIWDNDLNKTLSCQRYVTSRKLVLDEDDAIMIRNDQFPADCFSEMEILQIEGFVEKWVTFPYTLLERFPKLNELHVKNSSFEEIFPSHTPSFTSFHYLTVLKVSECHQLVYILTTSTTKSLVNLETMEIDDCEKLEEIVRNDTDEDVEGGITFNGLRILKLTHLPRLKTQVDQRDFNIEDRATNTTYTNIPMSLFSHNKVLLPKLEILELSYLNSLISLIWDDQLLHNSFNNLKTLKVERCGFVKLVPLHVLKSLNNLEEVEVNNCDMLEIVFDFEDLNDYYKEMDSSLVVVPLKKLELWNLPKLKNVWSDRYQGNISFPSLRSVVVYHCESLTSIFPASIAKGMLCDLEELQISYCSVDVIVAKDQVSESVAFTFGFPRLTSFGFLTFQI
ncbi:hypothetical protein K1719_041184 [Acacia pycnantha]|nr:hypothetical protein K1719_041184 [Acacia pycnantha]